METKVVEHDETWYPRTYEFESLHIKAGVKLKIADNSQNWCVFIIENDFKLDGTIEFINFSTQQKLFTFTFQEIHKEHRFDMQNVGGDGGNGGGSTTMPSGIGARGTTGYGGGAGSGGYRDASGGVKGADAVNELGGRIGSQHGGNGQKRGANSNGGLLFIKAKNCLFGEHHFIDLHGAKGAAGTNGTPGSFSSGGDQCAGGGGGGAPGGEGGVLLIRYETINTQANNFNLNGGAGGEAGRRGTQTSPHYLAVDGTAGEPGRNGYVDFEHT